MPNKFRQVTPSFWVSPQIDASHVADAAHLGVTLVICNRPDAEAPGQPDAASIEEAVTAAGINFAHIPFGRSGLTPEILDRFKSALDAAEHNKTLAYCASGTRSIIVYSYVAARAGRNIDEIIANAAKAGYDLSAHRRGFESLQSAP